MLSIVTKGYRLRFTSPPILCETSWEIRSPQAPEEIQGMREQISLIVQKNAVTEVPPNFAGFYSNVFLVRKASGGWRSVIDLKSLNAHIFAPHFRMFTTSSVLSAVRKGDYAFKIDLQDAYFQYIQAAGSTSGLPSKTRFISSGASLRSQHSLLGFYSLGAHCDRLSPSSRNFGYSLSRRLAGSSPRLSSLVTTPGSTFKNSRPDWVYSKQKEIRAGLSARYPVSWNSVAPGHRGSLAPRVQSTGDSSTHARNILPSSSVSSLSIPIYGLTQLGLRSYPSGSFVPETITTSFSFFRSDRPVYATMSVRSVGPCQPTSAMAGPVFSYLRNPYPCFSGGIYDLHGRPTQGWGAHMGIPKFRVPGLLWTASFHINCLELKAVVAALHHWVSVLQGHQDMIATDNSTVVSYINKQGGTRSHTLLRLVLELLMWLQARNIVI